MNIKWFQATRELWGCARGRDSVSIILGILFLPIAPLLDICYMPLDIIKRQTKYRTINNNTP